jgi:hypothetical protein
MCKRKSDLRNGRNCARLADVLRQDNKGMLLACLIQNCPGKIIRAKLRNFKRENRFS